MITPLKTFRWLYPLRAPGAPLDSKEKIMKKLPSVVFSLLLAVSFATAQNQNSNSNSNGSAANSNAAPKKRPPIFRATADQIKQAQALLKQRAFYNGEQTGKLDADTRAGLKKYQQAESLKVTGTLNKITLEKMGIALTDKQKVM
jgi:peptidoglycan hydrolase-like protein with peptidoglycan-binding domain